MDAKRYEALSEQIRVISTNMNSNIIRQLFTILHNNDFSDTEKKYIMSKVRLLYTALNGDYSFEQIRLVTENCGELLIKELDASPIEKPCPIEEITIDTALWEEIQKKYPSIKQLEKGIGYQGGIARVIARNILNIQANNHDDATTLSDIDVIATRDQNHKDIMNTYGADSRGISYLEDFSDANIKYYMLERDLTINQVFVTKDKLYITPEAKEGLVSGDAKIAATGRGFYGTKSYNIGGENVFASSMIDRGLWFLINKKISSLTIASHNLEKDNLDLLCFGSFGKTILVLMRRFYEKNTGDKSQILHNLADILVQLGYISTTEEFFEYCTSVITTTKFNINPPTFGKDMEEKKIEFDARWKLGKYGNILLKGLTNNPSGETAPSNILKNYKTDDTTPRKLSINEKEPSRAFKESLQQFETTHNL